MQQQSSRRESGNITRILKQAKRNTILALAVSGAILMSLNQLEAGAFSDSLEFGRADSEKSHALQTTGQVQSEMLATTVGTIKVDYPVRTLAGKGASISFTMKGIAHDKPAILEIQEIHNRRPQALGYTVRINNQDVYFRTYQEMGAGPNHYFINIPNEMLKQGKELKIVLQSEGPAPCSIGQIWLYSDFFGTLAKQEDVFQRMSLYIGPGEVVKGKKPLEAGEIYKQSYSGFESFGPLGLMAGFSYSANDVSRSRTIIDEALKYSGDLGLPTEITANGSCYGGAASGPDGLGGDFLDVQYNPMSWNPVSGRKNASWPNLWSNVPSHSWANPHLVNVIREKFRQCMTYLSDRMCFMTADGTLPEGQFQFNRELGIASDMFSDYNPYNVAAALKDGVVLDPRDGFSPEERMWLYNSITRIFQWMAKDYATAIGRCPVRVDCGDVQLPKYQWLDNIYMHTQMTEIRPLTDRRWYGWQTGVHPDSWSSGEFDVGTTIDDYLRCQGSLAKVNQERHGLKDKLDEEVKNQYEAGYRFVGFYSMHPGDDEMIRRVDKISDEPGRAIPHFDPNCLDINLDRDGFLGPADNIVSVDNLLARPTPSWHHTTKMVVKDVSKPGSVLYRLTNQGEEFPSGLNMTVMGRVSPGGGNRIEVATGLTPDNLSIVKVLMEKDLPNPNRWRMYQTTETTVDLGEGAKGHKEFYLRLTFHSEKAFDAAFIHELRVGMKWPRRTGQIAGANFTCGQNRILSLWVQDRAIAARSLARYREVGGEDEAWRKTKNLFDNGLYNSSYKAIVGEFSELLPARYAVRGHGGLGKYPVSVTLAGENRTALIMLEKVAAEAVAFSIKTEAEQVVKLEFSKLQPGRAYRLFSDSGNRYRIELSADKNAASALADADGKLLMDLTVKPSESRKTLPQTLSGVYLGGNTKKIKVKLQDLELTDYSSSLEIPVAANAVVNRRADQLPGDPAKDGVNRWPQPNDRVELTLSEKGEITGIDASYGIASGTIRSFQPARFDAPCNGIIELDNGRKYELTIGVECDTVFLHNRINQYEIESWPSAFRPGQPLEITYCPYTFKDRPPRILSVKQPYTVLMDIDYGKNTGDEWRKQAVDFKGVNVVPRTLDPNYLVNWIQPVLYPDEPFVPGYAVYKVDSEKPLDQVCVEFIGRVFEDSSRVEFFVATDLAKGDWKRCAEYNNGWANFIVMAPFSDEKKGTGKFAFVDVGGIVRGQKSFYLKVQLTRHADDQRYGFARLRVVGSH